MHAPLELGPQQGPQPAQVDRSGAVNRSLCAAPGAEGNLVLAGHRDRVITALVGGEEVLRRLCPSRVPGSDVAALVRAAQPQRRGGQFVAHVRAALTVARQRRPVGQPPLDLPLITARAGVPLQVAQPPVAVPEAQHQLQAEHRPLRADPARLRHLRGRQRLRGPQELSPAYAARLRLLPLLGVHRAHRVAPPAGPRAVDDRAAPWIDRVRRRDLQHPAAQHRVELSGPLISAVSTSSRSRRVRASCCGSSDGAVTSSHPRPCAERHRRTGRGHRRGRRPHPPSRPRPSRRRRGR